MRKVQKNKKKSMRKVKDKKIIARRKSSFLGYKIKSILTYVMIFCVISVVCMLLSSAILFKIKEIVVQGDEVCDPLVLIEKSGIKSGDNLFFANTEAASAKLEEKIPEVDTVTMTKKFPNRLIIDVKKATKVFCIEFDKQYICISGKGKVLEISDERDENLILLLDELVGENDNTEILKEIIAILNKASDKDKSNLKRMLQLLKMGLYDSEK